MKNFAVDPPSTAWEAIAARLEDDSQYANLSARMQQAAAAPPHDAWNNIAAALEEKTAPAVPVMRNRKMLYRAAAAMLLAGLLTAGFFLINKTNHTTGMATMPVRSAEQADRKSVTDSVTDMAKLPITVNSSTTAPALALVSPVKTNRSFVSAVSSEHNLQYAMVSGWPSPAARPIASVTAPPLTDNNGNPVTDIDLLNVNSNYLLVAGPNGQLTRISSKFANAIRFLNGGNADTEEYLDKVIRESGTWKKRFQEWRSKISQSAYIPSSANFLDIIEFKDLIQEK